MVAERAHWGSKLGFVLAAAGSAVGLGNIWGFPYITARNGGGLFVILYLACVALVGMPIMMAEIFIGRTAQQSPVGAYRALSRPGSSWIGLGWLSVVAAFVILSFYSVVAGWSMYYVWLSITEGFAGRTPDEITALFETAVAPNEELNAVWHIIFMCLTMGIVGAGIRQGIELWVRILMPALFILLLILLVYSMTREGFVDGFTFVFGFHADKFRATSTLDALGQAFFSLSLGMGALITYGSYLRPNEDLVATSLFVGGVDTAVALLSALVIFPILFTAGLGESESVGLAFISLPIAFSQMPGGAVLAPLFFILLTFAALTSAISLLEVAAAYFIDEKGWTRGKATLATGTGIMILGIPAALSGGPGLFGAGFKKITTWWSGGQSWFDVMFNISYNWMLPLGGLGIATFVAWRVGDAAREQGFKAGSRLGRLYWGWVQLLRYVVPIAVLLILLNAVGVFDIGDEQGAEGGEAVESVEDGE